MAQETPEKRMPALERSVAVLSARRKVDHDSFMTSEDYEALLRYRAEKRAGSLYTYDELLRELG